MVCRQKEQGITIDVAYRYFTTEKRKFIVADTPGHEQYTRNTATAASTASVAVIMVDARKGIVDQTRRHAFIVSLLGIKQVVLAVNKMDLIEYSKECFDSITSELVSLNESLGFEEIHSIPLSALVGENITSNSENAFWFNGSPLLEYLGSSENIRCF